MNGTTTPTSAAEPTTYRLSIRLPRAVSCAVGALGPQRFPAGRYVYIGSARRNIAARLRRHLGEGRRALHWHIDYLLTQAGVRVEAVETFADAECAVVAASGGRIVVAGFGASDCRHGCGSHLRYLGR